MTIKTGYATWDESGWVGWVDVPTQDYTFPAGWQERDATGV